MTEIETTSASGSESSELSDLETRVIKAVETCLISRTGPDRHANAVAAGEALACLKGTLTHGAFTDWVKANLRISTNTVGRYLKAYRAAVHGSFSGSRMKDRGRESSRFDDPPEELRALLLALSVIARQELPLARLVEGSERAKLAGQAREAVALMERLTSELSGGKIQ